MAGLVNEARPLVINELGLGENNCHGMDNLVLVQREEDDCTGYYSEVELRTREKMIKRAVSVPGYPNNNRSAVSKFLKRVQPKLKENFCLGKIIKWNDFCGQELRKRQGKSVLSMKDFCEESEDFWTKPTVVKVYSRNSTKKNGGGKMLKYYSESMEI